MRTVSTTRSTVTSIGEGDDMAGIITVNLTTSHARAEQAP